jgi:hypothetical protein
LQIRAFAGDPLVLDLNGDGLNLTAEDTTSPLSDMSGTGFVFHTGWVQPSDGILALDKNGNIDDVSELVGGQDSPFTWYIVTTTRSSWRR